MRTWHTVGDSHALYVWDQVSIPGWRIERHHLGSQLCYWFGEYTFRIVDIMGLGVRDGDAVCFSFGEIDCRIFAAKYGVASMIEPYLAAIAGQAEGRYRELHTAVMGVIPPVPVPPFRSNGTPAERLGYVLEFNRLLAAGCQRRGWPFLDVYTPYANAEGFLAVVGHKAHLALPGPLEQEARRAAASFG